MTLPDPPKDVDDEGDGEGGKKKTVNWTRRFKDELAGARDSLGADAKIFVRKVLLKWKLDVLSS